MEIQCLIALPDISHNKAPSQALRAGGLPLENLLPMARDSIVSSANKILEALLEGPCAAEVMWCCLSLRQNLSKTPSSRGSAWPG